MTPRTFHPFQLLAVAIMFVTSHTAVAQPVVTRLDDEFSRFLRKAPNVSDARSRADTLRDNGLTTPISPADRTALDTLAQYYVYRLTEPRYYTPPEPATITDIKPRYNSQFVTFLLADVKNHLHPQPFANSSETSGWDAGRRAYVAEFGASLDKAIRDILFDDKKPPAILREGAMRMLVVCCESGAPAHWKTVLGLLQDPKVEPEVALFALKAAENLFGTYELKRGWVHEISNNGKSERVPWLDEKTYVGLVQAVERYVLQPPPFLHRVAGSDREFGKPIDAKKLTPAENDVFRYYRVPALRALGRIRQESVGGKQVDEVRPMLTLARFAVGDPTIVPAPTSKDYAEAVIGLCSVVPDRNLEIDDVAFAVAYGLKSFSLPRSGAVEEDRSVLWKTTAERMRLAMNGWKDKVDKVARFGDKERKLVKTLLDTAILAIIDPMAKPAAGVGGSRLDVPKLDAWISANKPVDKATGVFLKDSPLKIAFPK